uniref:Uncharacterized protein n=1 Tax=Globisporangium ultimum (strain ATCC 200006 / CBS 805.95 / DAOM BR144) TaxID=431595 RepID=K3X6P0_GLOUD
MTELMRALLSGAVAVGVAQGARMAGNVTYCGDASHVALTTCNTGALPCGADQPCVQYPSGAAATCSEASRNDCEAYDATCTFQCLGAYNTMSAKWTLFIKDPKTTDGAVVGSTDPFPSAPVDKITSAAFSDETKAIQITGFDNTNIQKGSVKTVSFDADAFSAVAVLENLVITNVDLSTAASGLLPQSVSSLYLENCNLNAFPQDIATMRNLANLHFTKNVIAEMPANGSTVATALQKAKLLDLSANALTKFDLVLPEVTTLDLSQNQITTFPTAVFSMTKLTSLNLTGNSISSLQLTQDQYTMLKRLSAGALGISSVSGSCASGATEGKVLDSVVCVSASAGGSTTTEEKKSSSNSVVVIRA